MAATDLAIRIATTLDSSGITRADKAVSKLQRSVKGVSAALGAVAIGAFAKKSLRAFIEDEAAASKLTIAVKNLGLEFANPYISTYISNLEKTAQIADDEIRPAFQRLLQQTGSIAQSQSILNTALEVSRGTSQSLVSVSDDLAKAYYGNTKSLKKYSLGLTDVELKTKSFSELQDILNKKFTGSNAAYLNTYAGQLGVLSLAWNNLQENAGKALFTLAGANGDQSSGARRLGGIMDAFGVGLNEAAKLLNSAAMAFGQAYFGVGTPKTEEAPAAKAGEELFRKSMANDAKLKKIEERQAKLYKQQIAATKALAAEQKKQAALKKAGTMFDLDQAGILAALQGKLTEEERKRLELQFALLTGNVDEAKKLTYEIAKAQGLGQDLAAYLASLPNAKNPFESWANYLDMLEAQAFRIASMTGAGAAKTVSTASLPPISQADVDRILAPSSDRGISTVQDYFSGIGRAATNVEPLTTSTIGRLAQPMGSGSSTIGDYLNVTLQIDGKTIASALQDQSLSGNNTTINRTGG